MAKGSNFEAPHPDNHQLDIYAAPDMPDAEADSIRVKKVEGREPLTGRQQDVADGAAARSRTQAELDARPREDGPLTEAGKLLQNRQRTDGNGLQRGRY